jgi:hypothetical protein
MSIVELIFAALSLLLTILVLSYLVLGDNPLFRFAAYAFIGVAAAYVLLVTFDQVIWPKLIKPLLFGSMEQRILLAAPLLLSLLLLAKLFPTLSRVGNVPMAYLVGTAAAVTIGGALIGTLLPQSAATANLFDLSSNPSARNMGTGGVLLDGVYVLAGTLATLLYFYFGVRTRPNQPPARPAWIESIGKVGQFFIAITFGAVFSGVYTAAISALIERVSFLVDFFKQFGA